ncbi:MULTISPECIES: efflux RND transporter periplasmic adaptor subunit [unclassified Bradyrhizobium]|uniref:efflux RND transporter periplasmic adaptor subunit n=1 Tax=unclassified Bradyrhizobium TaxID=2631580 RepID=UPI001BA52385|nr:MULTISPECIES: efflux RND transporter periplasmic adaptor subunit [unclassified Bradyrhizobium]MBR1229587.1 efflux RND transporter periplasmic adaptor subunit [Bradyrhizobium sp. AUGA SZCCT0176]MBR1302390.1 efflux RND transporter periplasmic adaptor subunit [Bradyrhizobium sp. AUGA SZCCT0042]
MSITAKTHFPWLIALFGVSLTASAAVTSFALAEGTMKGADFVRVVPDQMHQLQVAKVETVAFRPQRSAIGQIGYNEDASTIVLTPFSGRVTRLVAKLGDQVKKGDPLLEIDSPEQLVPQNDFIAAQAARRKAGSQHNLAVILEKRVRDLHEGKAAPSKDLQQAEAQLAAAEHDLRSADTAFEAARVRLRILGRADAEISKLEQDGMLNRVTTITAPIDGTVVSRKVGPGQYVKADSGEALYTIADLSTVWLKAQIFEQDIAQVRIGQEIEARVSAVPNRVFKARINAINSTSDLTTRRVVVRSEIENADHALKSEMFAMFRISIGETSRNPAVPTDAVIREGDTATVWVETEPLLFKRRPVEIGIQQDGLTQIRSGLEAGEKVLARGAIFVDNEWRQ